MIMLMRADEQRGARLNLTLPSPVFNETDPIDAALQAAAAAAQRERER